MFRNRRYYGRRYGPARGYRRFGPGSGAGRRFYSPNCDWYPDRPRGWWATPEYQSQLEELGIDKPPVAARWSYYGEPVSDEAIDYEIEFIEKQIESLEKDIKYLASLRGKNK